MMAGVVRVILILMPFFIYFMWLRSIKRQQQMDSAEREKAREAAEGRMARAIGFGVAAAVAVIIWMTMETEQHERNSVYVPSHTENGQLVPGGFINVPTTDADKTKP
ncbi:DUF6111 family protein [Govanella unica]|uniref:DUF6111 family protein n=1 Tax=Govanella unica TaxID=2975056 RepID=A0A9X3TWU1_9PROT|nr:DUF6111 family protein [Govania unica]MDA5193150.1 DUF6111 family protein [Govania unica]